VRGPLTDGARVNDRHETVSDKFQRIHPREFHEHGVVQWLFGENYCTDDRGDCLDLFLFEIME